MRRFLSIALVAGLALPLIGCPIIVLKMCVNNDTPYALKELNMSPNSALSWGSNLLVAPVAAGGTTCVEGIEAGTYDIRGVFDVKALGKQLPNAAYNYNVEFTSTFLNLTYLWNGEGFYSVLDWFLK
ncbi:MAG: hypothetical protein GY851_24475 [bacterium]|nr:hypothetical protein [bacterium]